MSRFRLILLSVVAMALMGAFASASASAHRFLNCLENSGSGTKYENETKCIKGESGSGKWERLEVKNGEKISGTSGESKVKGELLNAEILITCKEDTYKGELETGGASKGEVTFEGCSASSDGNQLTSCEVPNIKFKFTDQLVGTTVEDELKPETGSTTFVTIEIKKKGTKSCFEEGKYSVTGTQKCALPEGSVFKKVHSIECIATGSSLEFNKKPATFESTDSVQLASDDSWAAE